MLQRWAQELSSSFITSLSSASNINLTDNSYVELDRDQLITTNDEYDYTSLTSGRERTPYGDYAAVLSLTITDREKLVGFTTYNSLEITFKTEIFDGSTYSLSSSNTKSIEALFSSSGPWRTINLLLRVNRDNIVEPITIAAKEHAKEVIAKLVCKKMNSV